MTIRNLAYMGTPSGTTGLARTERLRPNDFRTVLEFLRELYSGGMLSEEMHEPSPNGDGNGSDASRTRVPGPLLSRSRRGFGKRNRLLIDLIRPHLLQAYRHAEALMRTQKAVVSLTYALENVNQGVIVLTNGGRVQFANSCAHSWMTDYFAAPKRLSDTLPGPLDRWVRDQEEGIGPLDAAPSPRKVLVLERPEKLLRIWLISDSTQRILLLEEQRTTIDPKLIERLKLSRREAEVLRWVAMGKTNAEIGIILNLSRRTVQKHLERTYQKLGVENRTAAAAKVHDIVSKRPI